MRGGGQIQTLIELFEPDSHGIEHGNDSENDDHKFDDYHPDQITVTPQATRKSARQKTISMAGMESLANTPPRKSANRRIQTGSSARPQLESDDVIARLAIADSVARLAKKRAIIANSIEVRNMIGKRIEVLTNMREHALSTRLHGSDVPKTRSQMLKHKDKDKYMHGEQVEWESFNRLGVLQLVDRPKHANVMKCGWVYDTKLGMSNEVIYKARLVAKGYSQVYGKDFFDSENSEKASDNSEQH